MKDVYFTLVLAAMTATAVTTYGVHVVRRGWNKSARIDQLGGGSALLGRQIVEMGYFAMTPLARLFIALGFTANGVTWLALLLGIGAGVAAGFAWIGLAALLSTWSVICDVLDGQVARLTKTSSDTGEILDAAADRYTEFAFIGGLVILYRDLWWAQAIALAALCGSIMVSYATAKAEALQIKPPRGPMRRHERGAYLITAAGLSSFLNDSIAARWPDLPNCFPMIVALSIIAVAANYSAVMRLVKTAALVKKRAAE
ncbi:MAG TPA: CDP-alcohol phosphatidyltransferase family protein [Kofleriaceae bacterium]|nr:CDP-alcohol phosphatidyltransferase family protein [Kofleriaceae bacterium]